MCAVGRLVRSFLLKASGQNKDTSLVHEEKLYLSAVVKFYQQYDLFLHARQYVDELLLKMYAP